MKEYSWVPGASITHMEILHGAFRSRNPNALFMFRDNGYIEALPEEFVRDFVEYINANQFNLQQLKQHIRSRFAVDKAGSRRSQVVDYSAKVPTNQCPLLVFPCVLLYLSRTWLHSYCQVRGIQHSLGADRVVLTGLDVGFADTGQ
jgi:hypothetical protein